MDSASPAGTFNEPRSRRVGMARPPKDFTISTTLAFDLSSPPSPPIPARSPLRPPPRSSISTNNSSDQRLSSESSFSAKLPPTPSSDHNFDPVMPHLALQMDGDDTSFPSLDALIDSVGVLPELSKTLSVSLRPESPLALSPLDDSVASSSSSLSGQANPQTTSTTLSKRQHALHELLASERAYASDLALVREVYIPLALGHPVLIQPSTAPITPPDSSASSSRTVSTASDSSTSSYAAPMFPEDARIIFNNIAELAVFSDMFCDRLEEALGSVLDGGVGEDRVGELFLNIIPEMERPYKQYITRQGTADEHLQGLPKTPALETYFQQTRTYSTSVSHAWDLHSLLIKPVQRLLKYPLLLGTILEETSDSHPDKENLRQAKAKIEDVARNVNEERRRAEVVKGILMGDPKKKGSTATLGVAASVNLGKMKSLRKNTVDGKEGKDGISINGVGGASASGSAEATKVEKMAVELKRIEVFVQQFAKNVIDWTKSVQIVVQQLRIWAISFGKVIGLSDDQGSEAFDAFFHLVEQELAPLSLGLEAAINEKLLKEMAQLLSTMKLPFKLLASMEEQEPYHHHLLNMNVSAKNRPPPALLEASTNYLALRGQLANELPKYLELMHRGMTIAVTRLTEIQSQYWMNVRDRWEDLWEMLRVEGEMNAGAEETMEVWRSRWTDVEKMVGELRITKAPQKMYPSPVYQSHPPMIPAPIAEQYMYQPPQYAQPPRSPIPPPAPASVSAPAPMKRTTSNAVASVLQSLDPVHAVQSVSSPQPLSPASTSSRKTRGRGHSDASNTTTNTMATTSSSSHSKRSISKPSSFDNGFSKTSTSTSGKMGTGKPRPHADEWEDFFVPVPGLVTAGASAFSLPRTKSMPLPKAGSVSLSSSDAGAVDGLDANGYRSMMYASPVVEEFAIDSDEHQYLQQPGEEGGEGRGREGRKPSFKRRISETLRSHSSSRQNLRPGSSKGSSTATASTPTATKGRSSLPVPLPTPTPTSTAAAPHPTPSPFHHHGHSLSADVRRDSWSQARGKYTCQVIHPCRPPAPVSYQGFPFFTLVEGDLYAILHEAGHPSLHKKLPLYVDDGEDCLLLCRNEVGVVGWALASFLEPIEPFS